MLVEFRAAPIPFHTENRTKAARSYRVRVQRIFLLAIIEDTLTNSRTATEFAVLRRCQSEVYGGANQAERCQGPYETKSNLRSCSKS